MNDRAGTLKLIWERKDGASISPPINLRKHNKLPDAWHTYNELSSSWFRLVYCSYGAPWRVEMRCTYENRRSAFIIKNCILLLYIIRANPYYIRYCLTVTVRRWPMQTLADNNKTHWYEYRWIGDNIHYMYWHLTTTRCVETSCF